MSLLGNIKTSVQQVAEAIGIALGVEVEIVDNRLNIIGGTGVYSERIGQLEEQGNLEGKYLYARVLRTGKTQYVADAIHAEDYDERESKGTVSGECAEICTPITLNGEIIGIIGMIAFDESQRVILADTGRNMIGFIERMADLLAAKAEQQNDLENAEESRDEMSTVLETAHEGIFALNQDGNVKHCNNIAAGLFKTTKRSLTGRHISEIMPDSPAIKVLSTGRGYTENEEIFSWGEKQYHFIVTVKPVMSGEGVEGAVVSFRDISEARKLIYNFNNKTLKNTVDDIIGSSKSIMAAKRQTLMIARGSSTVLITGESGTGKEMFAKAIHYAGARASKPFVTVNCGAISESTIEGELFGYDEGALPGLDEKGKSGKFEQAEGGTLFLDEIGSIPLHLQVKILDVLQNNRIKRVGGHGDVSVDVRIIAATNRNLEQLIDEGKFREDFYYKLSVIPLYVPPLRERKEDIRMLMYHFLKRYNAVTNRKIERFLKDVEKLYVEYEWPGNVRELENAVEYGVNMAFGNEIGLDEVPLRILKHEEEPEFKNLDMTLADQVRIFERKVILEKLKKNGGIKEAAARDLGLSRATLYRKLSEIDLS